MLNRITFAIALLFTGSLAAAPDLCQPLTLCELVSVALENNPETSQAWWAARRAAAYVGIAQSGYYPKVDIHNYVKHGRDFKFIDGPDVNYTALGADVLLSMMLYDFGSTRAGVDAAKRALLAADWHNDWVLQRVMVRVMENAYSALHAQETLKAMLASLEDAKRMLHSSNELNRAGLRSITDTYTSQATLAQMQMDVAQQRALLDIQIGKLASSMGLPADTPLILADIDLPPVPDPQPIACLIALAKEQRSDLMAKQERLAETVARQARAKASYWPKLSLAGRGGADHYVHDKASAAHYEIALNLDIPIFNGFERAYQNRLAFADTQVTCEELAQLELDIALEVLTHSRSLEAAQEMLKYADDNLRNAMSAYDGVLQKYHAGKEGIAEASNALRQLSAARIRFSDVRTRYLVSMANLAYATGTLRTQTETPCE